MAKNNKRGAAAIGVEVAALGNVRRALNAYEDSLLHAANRERLFTTALNDFHATDAA